MARSCLAQGADAVVLMAWTTLSAWLASLLQATGHVVLTPSGVSGIAVTALAVGVLICALASCMLMAAWFGRFAARRPDEPRRRTAGSHGSRRSCPSVTPMRLAVPALGHPPRPRRPPDSALGQSQPS
jgi:hypothetical protein